MIHERLLFVIVVLSLRACLGDEVDMRGLSISDDRVRGRKLNKTNRKLKADKAKGDPKAKTDKGTSNAAVNAFERNVPTLQPSYIANGNYVGTPTPISIKSVVPTNPPVSSKSSGKATKSPAKGKISKGKNKNGNLPGCVSRTAATIRAHVPEVVTQNPQHCCNFDGPTAIFITHSQTSNATSSGFEIFWNNIYDVVMQTSAASGVCFVMTGVDQTEITPLRSLEEILIEANEVAHKLPNVPAIMSTDPTDNPSLVRTIRSIANEVLGPSIGVWNAGWNNILSESITSNKPRLPFIGYKDDTVFGLKAANITSALLGSQQASPLCLNARPDLTFVGERCSSYYGALTSSTIEPATGVPCSTDTSPHEILALITAGGINAILSHVDCCAAAANAVAQARNNGQNVIIGCTDSDTSGGKINFVTEQPAELEGYSASTWANNVILATLKGEDGRSVQFFPGGQSFLNTAVFNQLRIM